MTGSAPQVRPFFFDTEFDASGDVVRASAYRPVRRSYQPAEVDALVAQARLEAREAALAEAAAMQAMAVASVSESVAAAAATAGRLIQAHREQAVDLALAAGRVIAGAALDRAPLEPLQAALAALGRELDASPRLVVRMGGLDDATRRHVEQACADAGFGGVIAFRDEPGMPAAAFRLEWADGCAVFDPHIAASRIAEAVASAMAGEAGHAEALAETLNEARSD